MIQFIAINPYLPNFKNFDEEANKKTSFKLSNDQLIYNSDYIGLSANSKKTKMG